MRRHAIASGFNPRTKDDRSTKPRSGDRCFDWGRLSSLRDSASLAESIPRTEVRGCRMSLLRNFVSHFDLASLPTTACNAERQQRTELKAVSRFEPLLVVEYQPPRLPGALRPSAHGWRPFTQPLPTTSYLCSARSHPWKPRGPVIGCGLRIRSRFEHQRLPC